MNFERLLGDASRLGRSKWLGPLESVAISGVHEITLTFERPFAPLRERLAAGILSMVCPQALNDPNWQLSRNPCGTGPYALETYSPAEMISGVRRPDHWRPGIPKASRIVFRVVPEDQTRAAMLRTNEAQFVFPMPLESMRRAASNPAVVVESRPSTLSRFLSMNTKKAPFSDLRVRMAISSAIDRRAIVRAAWRGEADPAVSPIPAAVTGAQNYGEWPYDPEHARALLRKAGYPQGFETVLWCAFNDAASRRAVQVIRQQLMQVGIRASIRMLEAGERVRLVYGPKTADDSVISLYYTGWSAGSDVDWAMRPILHSKSAPPVLTNTAYYDSRSVDLILDSAVGTVNAASRTALYAQAQNIAWYDAPYAWLAVERAVTGRRRGLTGFSTTPDGGLDFLEAAYDPHADTP